ncbi:MAG: hypothetical protein JW751_01870 [Polyangiaceae bacterium]|nr:hypothetical protein [Polyangiaceae bacterium]
MLPWIHSRPLRARAAFAVALSANAGFAASPTPSPAATALAPSPAASAPPPARPYHAPVTDLTLAVQPGLMAWPKRAGGIWLETSALYRHGVLAVGSTAEVGGLLMTVLAAGGLAGFALRADGGFRAELLGTAGARYVEGWGAGLLDDDPGADACLAYAGGRLRLGHVFTQHRLGHFFLGGALQFDRDLWTEQVTSTYTTTGWFSGESYTRSSTETVGGTRYAVALAFGGVLDLDRHAR